MSDELRINLDPFKYGGLALLAKVYDSEGNQEGVTTTMVENQTGVYTGDFSLVSVPDGEYMVSFQTTTAFYGYGKLYVKDAEEVTLKVLAQDVDLTAIKERTDRIPDSPSSTQDIIVGYNS